MPDSPAAHDLAGREINADAAHEAKFVLAKCWLQECITSHSACRSPSQPLLPTRLIEVEPFQRSSDVRLVLPSPGMRGHYAALSYCWGAGNQVILTKSNIDDRRARIESASLPKTIQDALVITRNIGLKYLWVDALCILQDSATDWETESARMGHVYNLALVTIQAAVAGDCREGCLNKYTASDLPPAQLRYVSNAGEVGKVYVRQSPLVTSLSTEPLHDRGWTLQEALLSPRILSFGSTQMSWECSTCYRSEGGSSLANSGHSSGLPKPVRRSIKDSSTPAGLPLDDVATQRALAWANIVREYSWRNLTFPSDKLPALSGLARYLSNTRPGDVYLAGLWRSEMPGNLFWAASGSAKKPTTRPTQYRAPSWSWASVNGPVSAVSCTLGPCTVHCEIVAASVTHIGLDTFGEVQAGKLTVYSQMKEVWRIFDETNASADGDVQFFYPEARALLLSDRPFFLKLGICALDILDSSQKLHEPVSTWMLRITELDGLALRARVDGTFERVGHYSLDDDKAGWFEDCERREVHIV